MRRPRIGEPRSSICPRSVSVRLDDQTAEAITNYMRSLELPTPQAAIRELITVALAATPYDGALLAARMRAFQETKVELHREVTKFISDLAFRWNLSN